MNKLQKDQLTWMLSRRLELIERIQAQLENIGDTSRQIMALDQRVTKWIGEENLEFPETLMTGTFKLLFDQEFQHQLEHGDPPRGSFLAALATPRLNLELQTKEIHGQILSGTKSKGEQP